MILFLLTFVIVCRGNLFERFEPVCVCVVTVTHTLFSYSTFVTVYNETCKLRVIVCVCGPAGGGGEEAQSLPGLQLSGASESDLLRQL